jgi:hypothetical protein
MGFWGTLGKLGLNIGGAVAAPFTGGMSLIGTGALTSMLGSGKKKTATGATTTTPETDPTKLLTEQGSKMFGASEPAFEQALGTYGKLAGGDKGMLASFTGTGLDDLNRAYSSQVERASSTMNRGGAQSKILAEAPGALERDALALRSNTRSGALDKLGSLGLAGAQAGNQAIGVGGNLKLGQGRLDLERRGQNIGIAEDIGQGVGSILDKTGVWDKLGGAFGKMFGGGGGDSSLMSA